jgi:LacI family transcriptional regulator
MVDTPIRIIGLVVPDLLDSHFAEIQRGVASILRPQGYTVLLANSEGDAQSEQQVVGLLLGCPQVEGLLLASSQVPEEVALFKLLEKHKLPYVLIDRCFPGVEANYVGADDEAIGALATEHLIARGCRHIAHIQGPETSNGIGRARGYTSALARHGLKLAPGYIARGGAGDASGYQAMRKLLEVNPRLDGVVCFNDAVAVGAIKAILEAGLEVPYDLEVVGAGNLHYSDILRVPLSTIDLNSALVGERAAELLLRLKASDQPLPPEKILIPSELIPRESSKAICV